jgi:hypothetical protein
VFYLLLISNTNFKYCPPGRGISPEAIKILWSDPRFEDPVMHHAAFGKFHDQGDRPVREGVSKGEEDGRRPLSLQAGHPPNSRKAVWGVACLQGV